MPLPSDVLPPYEFAPAAGAGRSAFMTDMEHCMNMSLILAGKAEMLTCLVGQNKVVKIRHISCPFSSWALLPYIHNGITHSVS